MNLQEYVLRLRNSTLAFSNEFKLPSRRTSRLQSVYREPSETLVQEGHFPKSRSIGGSSPVKDPARINQSALRDTAGLDFDQLQLVCHAEEKFIADGDGQDAAKNHIEEFPNVGFDP
ncbi:hypothetical protein DY000_02006271 [Brassica cretica]|uniref:Uncharacterized protein n=1 Tax=Brassica cretica TaxID=69181 RepID=A0ABQ7CCF5_BRACR|nr:hypothetical protein DY000_02006271 [Brassica cretica]